jgi:hypothetical protein
MTDKSSTQANTMEGSTANDSMDHHANQLNSNSGAFKAAADNRSNQMNPNHGASKAGSRK